MEKYDALLLLGPTGAGKTPLGDYLQQHGLAGQRCWHFDFGARLRFLAHTESPPSLFSPKDIDYIRQVLKTNALLDNDRFYIAHHLLRLFIREKAIASRDLIILNGLPRHVDQARNLTDLVRVRRIVYFECPPETVRQRLQQDPGQDRRGRPDDTLPQVENKLAIFRQWTQPVLEHYRCLSVPVTVVPVTATQTPAQAWQLVTGFVS